ncbi:hypothetical protein FNH22_30885 [Fulvivirga sp. M361]|nr:hypothetical protein FNH22_30885 [Fulvivirga sp. M361]
MTTISKTSHTIFHFIDRVNTRSKHLGNQLLNYLATEPHVPKNIASSSQDDLFTEKIKDVDSEKHIVQRTKIKFETRRHWQPMKWK